MRGQNLPEFESARQLLDDFKADSFKYGNNILDSIGTFSTGFGKRAVLIHGTRGLSDHLDTVKDSLKTSGIDILATANGAAANAPLDDLSRMTEVLMASQPDVIIGFGAGSTLDCIKAAEVVRKLGGDIEDYFGVGQVSEKLIDQSKSLTPLVAIQTAASSASHLTKYSNITDLTTGQKKLIVDEAIVPAKAIFDYCVTHSCPESLTIDGALDGISHSLEVLYGAVGGKRYDLIYRIAHESIRLIVKYLPLVLADANHAEGREALGLGTDLGGYAIMLGGTNGAHLNSFSFVDVLSHGRACGMLNPYYSVFFAPAVEEPLRMVAGIFQSSGFCSVDIVKLKGRELGLAVADAMLTFINSLGIATKLADIEGFTHEHIERALTAAKNPQLRMKLENMPVALTPDSVDIYMRSVLEAAMSGEPGRIRNYSDYAV